MPVKVFFDTNILIYAIVGDDPRSIKAGQLLQAGGTLSVQVLNEFVSVARRKLSMSWQEIAIALDAIRTICPSPLPITLDTHLEALNIAEKYGFKFYDALIIAAALEGKCKILYSEDFHHSQCIAGRLTVNNPFRP